MPKVFPSAASVFNLHQPSGTSTNWFRVENKAGTSAPSKVYIYDEIGMYGVTANQFVGDLNNIDGPIELHLSTAGGEVWDGITIYNALKNRTGVSVIVDSIAASIGSVIAMGADPGKLFMEPTAKLMIHDGFCMAAGNAAELSALVEQLNDASDTIAGIYATRTGTSPDDWRAAMVKTTWYTAQAAVDAGLADGVLDASKFKPAAAMALMNKATDDACPGCSIVVADLAAKFCSQCGTGIRNADSDGPTDLGSGWVQDPDGTTRFDPDGDGDDDSTPEGDTDHDYWDADGNQIQNVPPCPTPDGGSDSGEDAGEDITGKAKPKPDDDGDGKQPFPGAAQPFKKKTATDEATDELTAFLISALRDAAQPHGAMTGTHSHPHPAYGSQGGDTSHDHSHSHDGDAAHSHSHSTASEDHVRTALGDALDTSPWRLAQAWHNAASSDDPAAFYAAICAGRKTGNPAFQSSWALPYRYTPDSPPNADGARAALERLNQTDGLTNPGDARQVLQSVLNAADLAEAVERLNSASAAVAQIIGAHEHHDGDDPDHDHVIPALSADGVDRSPWNPAQAWHNAALSSDPAEFYAGICAGRKRGDPSLQSSWALPYRYTPSSLPNADGARKALDRLPSANGLVNRNDARLALEAVERSADLADAVERLNAAKDAVAGIVAAQTALDALPADVAPVETAPPPAPVLMASGVDNTPWNASKAWHNGATSDDPATFYAGICAGKKSGDPSNQSAWALPFKYHPGDPPNAAGVKNALARLPQTEGLTNAAEAKSTLQKAMKQVNPDYEPDDLAELFRTMHNSFAQKEA